MAIRDNPIAASTMGINTALYKTTTFGISAMYTGIAGALSVFVTEFVAPTPSTSSSRSTCWSGPWSAASCRFRA